MKNRAGYIIIVVAIILLGIGSRKIAFIPLCVGDVLYAVLIYFIIRTLFIQKPKTTIALISILTCFCIEFSQLYQAEWINNFRNTFIGHHILGQGFLWTDLLAYTFGVLVAYSSELIFKKADS